MEGILQSLSVSVGTVEKPVTHTLMTGGKYHVPKDKLSLLYKKILKHGERGEDIPPLVEKIGDILPLLIDIDIKYAEVLEERQYSPDTVSLICSFLWSRLSTYLDLTDESTFGEIWILEKKTPYPCSHKDYPYKDGIHIVFPKILIQKTAYKRLIEKLKEEREIEKIFERTCQVKPANKEETLFDGCFTSWQPYGCSKKNETPYVLTQIFTVKDCSPTLMDSQMREEYYSDNLVIANACSVAYRESETVSYLDPLKTLLGPQKQGQDTGDQGLKLDMDTLSIEMAEEEEDIYGLTIEDQTRIASKVDDKDIAFIRKISEMCLSKERAGDYKTWTDVGMCLCNLSRDLLDTWKTFSSKDSGYSADECNQKWKSFCKPFSGRKLGMGSLDKWAREDNPEKYLECQQEHLAPLVDNAVKKGPEADYLVAKVIHKYFKNKFICVDVSDEWYWYEGHRWKVTKKGTALKNALHNEIYCFFGRYYHKYAKDHQEDPDSEDAKKKMKNVVAIQLKLSTNKYVNTLLNSLRDLFHQDHEKIMEVFDTDHDLLGFENGVYDLKNHVFREGIPEDYITMSTGIKMPVKDTDLPIHLDQMVVKVRKNHRNFDKYNCDYEDFLEKIVPHADLRAYVKRFLSKCISGENRDEGFYIWTGSGGNGKSKLINLMCACLGDYACNLPVSLLTQKRKSSGAADPEMARTRGKRFVYMQEPDVNETLNVGEMKEITGNDTIQARSLFKEPFEFVPQFKLVLMCNDLPKIPSNDDGTWRRLQALPFVSRFVDDEDDVNHEEHCYIKDKQLKERLDYWVIPMFIMLLKEWREYDKHNIVLPDSVKDRTNEYRNENDIVGQWVSERCAEAPNEPVADGVSEIAPTEFSSLHPHFKDWCEEQEVVKHLRPDLKGFKTALVKWQRDSRFGLKISKRKTDKLKPNGYEACPRINLVLA